MILNGFNLRILALCLAFFVTMGNSFASNSVCDHKIIFLPQVHGIDKGLNVPLSDSDKLKIAESQLRILVYLKKEKPSVIFNEEKTERVLRNVVKKLKSKEITGEQFQVVLAVLGLNSIPVEDMSANIESLNAAQIEALINYGAVKLAILNHLVELPYPVIQDRDIDRVFGVIKAYINSDEYSASNAYPEGIAQLVYQERERLALKEINSYFRDHPNTKELLLIFGGNHNFSFYPDLFPPECIIVPEEFRHYWPGENRLSALGF